MILKERYSILLIAVILFSIISCTTVHITVPITRPAEVNLKDYRRIAVGRIEGPASEGLSNEIMDALFASGRFEIVDREHLEEIMREHKLSMSGVIDKTTALQIGDFTGASVMLFGNISTYYYDEKISKNPWRDKKNRKHVTYKRKGIARIEVRLQLVDLTTGKILAVKNLKESISSSRSATDRYPPVIDGDLLLRMAREKVVKKFMQLIAPYTIYTRLRFYKDRKIPLLGTGISFARAGEWEEAVRYFNQAVEQYPNSFKSFYNLGMAYSYQGEFEESLKKLNKALVLNPDNKSIIAAIRDVKTLKKESQKLLEQQIIQ
jgi:hypothetical protein